MPTFDTVSVPAAYPSHHKGGKFDPRFKDNGQFDTTLHMLAGQPVKWMGRELSHPSQFDLAAIGVFLKWKMAAVVDPSVIPAPFRMKSSEHQFLGGMLENCFWSGEMDEEYKDNFVTLKVDRRKLDKAEITGFMEEPYRFRITPSVMQDTINLRVLLGSQFLPYVRVVPINVGRRRAAGKMVFRRGDEPSSIKTPAVESVMAQRDTEIVTACAAIEVGALTESDPDKLGAQFIDLLTPKQVEWFDRVITTGNGVNEPLGIFNTDGCLVVLSQNGTNGPPHPKDYEGLLQGVGKPFRHEKDALTAFVGDEHTYRRACAMLLDDPTYQRFFGGAERYAILDRPFLIHESLSHSLSAFVNLHRYRMYASNGFDIRFDAFGNPRAAMSDKRLDEDPKPAAPALLVTRQRFGGQMDNENAVAIIRDGQE